MLILLVDDDEMILRALKRWFEHSGFQTVTAHGVEEASGTLQLMLGQDKAPDLIISDVDLLDGTGFQLAERVHRGMERVPLFVFMSASITDSKQAEAERFSADLVDKVDLSFLARAVEKMAPAIEQMRLG